MTISSQPAPAGIGGSILGSGRIGQAQMRSAHLGLILRQLRANGGRSRARLAAETGLSKATMTSLIQELADRGMVTESTPDRDGSVGRPGLIVNLDGRRVAAIGVEINVDYLAVTAVDLTGAVIRENTAPIAAASLSVPAVLDRIAIAVRRVLDSVRDAGLIVVGLTVSPPGVIDYDTGTVRFAANLGWRNVPLVAELAGRLGPDAPVIHLENDAKLAAVAEYANHASRGIQDLLFLTSDVGVGAGIIAGGQLVRGWSGFSGEVGHLPLDPQNRPCNCGRRGCWEKAVGLEALLELAADPSDPVHDLSLPLEDRLAELHRRAADGDERTLSALARIIVDLADGLSILVDVLNPQLVVLGGYYAHFGDHLLEPLAARLAARRMDEGSRVELAVSRLGVNAAAQGGALSGLERVFADPTIVAAAAQ